MTALALSPVGPTDADVDRERRIAALRALAASYRRRAMAPCWSDHAHVAELRQCAAGAEEIVAELVSGRRPYVERRSPPKTGR